MAKDFKELDPFKLLQLDSDLLMHWKAFYLIERKVSRGEKISAPKDEKTECAAVERLWG